MSDFNLVPCDGLFARMEENLSSYTSNGLLDTEQFYPEIKWLIAQLGLAVFEMENALVTLSDHRVELPCDFYLLDSAWLCSNSKSADPDVKDSKYYQGKSVFFTVRDEKVIVQNQSCPPPNYTGWSVNACDNNAIIEEVKITEYVTGAPNSSITWCKPTLLKLNNKKDIQPICSKQCPNLFYSSPNEISINKRSGQYYLVSNLKEPVIYLKYWKYPIDRETNLPLIPEDPILQKAIEAHLTHWLLIKLATNGEVADIWNLIKYWEQQKMVTLDQAKCLAKMPTFNGMVELARTTRRRWQTYEQIMRHHY